MKHFIFLYLNLFITFAALQAQNLPGDPSLPSSSEEFEKLSAYEQGEYKLSVEDFLSAPEKSRFKMSAGGLFLSYYFRDSLLIVQEISTGNINEFSEIPVSSVQDYFWSGDKHLLFIADKDGNEIYHLYSLNIESKTLKDLTPFEGVSVRVLSEIDTESMVVAMNKDDKTLFEPYLINKSSGELKKLFDNKLEKGFITDYYFDKKGNLRAYYKQTPEGYYVLCRRKSDEKNSPFEDVFQLGEEELFVILSFVDDKKSPKDNIKKNSDLVYATSSMGSDKRNIVLYDLKENRLVKTLFSNDRYDIDEITQIFSDGEIDFYSYEGVKKHIVPVSKTFRKLHKKIKAKFPGFVYTIQGISADKSKMLIYTESDRVAGRYYLFSPGKKQFKLLADLKPELKANELTDKTSFSFRTRDNLLLEGYYYRPLNSDKEHKAPLLIIPHGGPYDLRNSWEFINYAQLFANRGYCVLEINFRGSYGYGKRFQSAGFKQVGRKMLDDIEDGVRFMAQKDWIDKERVGIYGPSYGGLAVLQSLVRSSDLYKCGIDYCGPSNLFTLFESFPPSWKEYIAYFHRTWYDPNVKEEAEVMKTVSPFFHTEKIKTPLMVIHGANDPRVKISESDQIVKKLRKQGLEVPYLVKYDEGHGFVKEKNNIELNKIVLGFLAKHLKN